jgi:hypothetical protein
MDIRLLKKTEPLTAVIANARPSGRPHGHSGEPLPPNVKARNEQKICY